MQSIPFLFCQIKTRRWIRFRRAREHFSACFLSGIGPRRWCTFWHRRGVAVGRPIDWTLWNKSKERCGPRVWSFVRAWPFIRSRCSHVSLVSRIPRWWRSAWRWPTRNPIHLRPTRRPDQAMGTKQSKATLLHEKNYNNSHDDNNKAIHAALLSRQAIRSQRKTK